MKQRLLLFIFTLLTGAAANAQTISYGLTSRAGAFYTLTSEERSKETDYGIGVQFTLGAWATFPVSPQSKIQLNLLQTAERQFAGEVQVVNEDRQPISDAKVRDQNLAVAFQAIYLYSLTERSSIGVGLGSKYEYFSENRIEKKYRDYLIQPSYQNKHRQNLTLHIPVEAQYKLSERFTLVGQAQLQLSNRIEANNTDYREHDLGITLGVNYSLK